MYSTMYIFKYVLCFILAVLGFVPVCTYYFIAPNYHTLTSIDGRSCQEEYGRLHLNYKVTLDSHIKASAYCGTAENCNDECGFNYILDDSYYVKNNRIIYGNVDDITILLSCVAAVFLTIAIWGSRVDIDKSSFLNDMEMRQRETEAKYLIV